MPFFSNRTKLREGALPAVEAWVSEITQRSDEFKQTMRDEGITFEVWIVAHGDDGLYLISLMETDDYDRAIATYERSTHAIDAYHAKFLDDNRVDFRPNRVVAAFRTDES